MDTFPVAGVVSIRKGCLSFIRSLNNHVTARIYAAEAQESLIEEAQQRQAANDIDAELADQRRPHQERRASDDSEAATVTSGQRSNQCAASSLMRLAPFC